MKVAPLPWSSSALALTLRPLCWREATTVHTKFPLFCGCVLGVGGESGLDRTVMALSGVEGLVACVVEVLDFWSLCRYE